MKKVYLILSLAVSAILCTGVESNAAVDLSEGLVAHYPFNGSAIDESGNGHDGTVNGATLTEDRFGNADSAYHFDGANNYIRISDNADFTVTDFTLCAWVRTSDKSDMKHITSCWDFGVAPQWYNLWLNSGSGTARIGADQGGYVDVEAATGTTDLANDEWHFVVGVRDTSNSEMKIYVDGVLEDAVSDISSDALNPDVDFWIGGQKGWPARFFNGDIDDVRMYNRALSEEEVSELNDDGRAELIIFSDDLTDMQVVAEESVTQSIIISNAGNADLEFSFCTPIEQDEGLIASYPFNGSAIDESGNGYDGTVYGAMLTEDRFGNADSAYHFDGVNDHIRISDNEDFTVTDFTLCAWIKTSDKSDMKHITSCWDSGVAPQWYNLWLISGTGTARIAMDQGGYVDVERATGTTDLADDEWHFVVGVRDTESAELKIYIDGVLEEAVSDISTNALNPNVDLWIGGQNGWPTRYFNGDIDDVRMYNRALSEEEVSELNNDGDGLLASYPFNGNANDESGHGHDGAVNGATLTEDRFGNPESAYLFDGSSSYIEIVDSEALRLANTDFTISTWSMNLGSAVGHNALLIKRGSGGNDGWFHSLKTVDSNSTHPFYIVSGGLYAPRAQADATLTANEWVHTVLTYDFDAQKVSFFVNGVFVSEHAGMRPPNPATIANLFIGRDSQSRAGDLYRFNGAIDDVRIYSRALSDAEITELYSTIPSEGSPLPEWLTVEPKTGAIAPGASMEIDLTLTASNMIAGDYVEHMLDLFANGSVLPVGSVPVSMWVIPPAPVMVAEPTYTARTSNEVFWLPVEGPVEYWAEAVALEHCAPGSVNMNGGAPRGWSNAQRFHDADCCMQESGWMDPTNYIFSGLHLNTVYGYRVKASVMTEIGRLEGAWSAPVGSCQVPLIRKQK